MKPDYIEVRVTHTREQRTLLGAPTHTQIRMSTLHVFVFYNIVSPEMNRGCFNCSVCGFVRPGPNRQAPPPTRHRADV